jgi:hypothetical protein
MKPADVRKNLDCYDTKRLEQGAKAPTLNGEYRILSAAMKRGLEKR